ncbi:30S ribosomal protein S18 [Candidatus Peregrinibacteria bacterium CG11_big_fil_rev_8_21_14_0_20_41_10]|nr:MAG: 30S ribosomal protein S18 [Candidatus Peregrinibacteria bacterium CG11_big_fil_rev_8_21_14_0_20_41_10]PIZ74829.1 MAG: 30S ribosomal protein S18 [Candidatus Peregrinibacteria bacterium CG_4_10_14_0_2_um_filter_41_8]PJC38191.1 MAG: 30S ribosomal protein S18 [Candidatus Peregrinibacteria bacterium CG_4_9_14_0_2_um_filter_41_14]
MNEVKEVSTPTENKKLEEVDYVDYKNLKLLRQYTTRYGKIRPRYYSGVSLRFQKRLALGIKRARFMALLPYVK